MLAWLAVGGLAGVSEAVLLDRAARGRARPSSFVARIAAVAGVLLAAAVFGGVVGLLPAVLGWLVGLGVSVGVLAWRWT